MRHIVAWCRRIVERADEELHDKALHDQLNTLRGDTAHYLAQGKPHLALMALRDMREIENIMTARRAMKNSAAGGVK